MIQKLIYDYIQTGAAQKIILDYVKSAASPAIRWLVQILAVWLVAQGYTDQDSANAFIDQTTLQLVGVVLSVVTLSISIALKLYHKYMYGAALESSPDASRSEVRQKVIDRIKGAV
ncbi:MAG TPA: hypothetical protein VGB00_19385 [Pyrinomonadaceae bacterium]